MKKFWMVFLEGRSTPARKHDDIGKAMVEAERLATIERVPAHVLECVASCQLKTVEWQIHKEPTDEPHD